MKTQFVGKVINGRIVIIGASEAGRVIGKVSPVQRQVTPVVVRTEPAYVNTVNVIQDTMVDSPFIAIANQGHIEHLASREARLAQLAKDNKRRNTINSVKSFIGLDH